MTSMADIISFHLTKFIRVSSELVFIVQNSFIVSRSKCHPTAWLKLMILQKNDAQFLGKIVLPASLITLTSSSCTASSFCFIRPICEKKIWIRPTNKVYREKGEGELPVVSGCMYNIQTLIINTDSTTNDNLNRSRDRCLNHF